MAPQDNWGWGSRNWGGRDTDPVVSTKPVRPIKYAIVESRGMSGDSVQWVKVDQVTFNSIHGRTKKNKGGIAEKSASYAFGMVCGRHHDGYPGNVGIGHIDNTGRIFQVTQCTSQMDMAAFDLGFAHVRGR